MVRIIDADVGDTQTFIASKRVICFGAGRRLGYFRENNPEIRIAGIIDNNKSSNCLHIGSEEVPVWFPEEPDCRIDRDTIIVITSMAVDEIVDQMDKIDKFEGVSCYVEAVLDAYIGLEENQKLRMEKMFSRLVHRTCESILEENYGKANLASDVKRYQVCEYFDSSDTAWGKARTDIKMIIGNMGYQVMKIHCCRETDAAEYGDRLARADWTDFFQMIQEHSIVFMQFPALLETSYPGDIMLHMKEKKHVQFICLVHDVEHLRNKEISEMRQKEFELMQKLSDFLLVHNDVMKGYFEKIGIEKNRIAALKIFDYLHNGTGGDKHFENTIIFAGNLSREKSPFLEQVGRLAPLRIRLYGHGFNDNILSKADNIDYCGSFSAEMLPQRLDRGFGLVWDGGSLDICAGRTGEYLRYNNPHKMSLYLSAGLPVIIWSGAAQSRFVRENKVGIVVDSLYDIKSILDGMDNKEYSAMAHNAENISKLLKKGHYTELAVKKAEEAIESGKADGRGRFNS